MPLLRKIAGLLLIALGVVALVVGSVRYTSETHDADLGPLKFQVKEKKETEIPKWVGVVAIAAGAAVLLFDRRRS